MNRHAWKQGARSMLGAMLLVVGGCTSSDAHVEDEAADTVAGMDPELLVNYLLLHAHTILDRTEEDDIHAYENAWNLVWTPDRDFVLVMAADLDEEVTGRVRRLLELMYRRDLVAARATSCLGLAWNFQTFPLTPPASS